MKGRLVPFFLPALLLLIMIHLVAGGEVEGDALVSAVVTTTPLPGSTRMSPEQEIVLFKSMYLKAGDDYLAGKKYRQACMTYQKLLDLLFKKSLDSNFDLWMGSYGKLYKQVDLRQNRAKALYIESRRRQLEKVFREKSGERLATSPLLTRVTKRRKLRSSARGSLSIDGELMLSSIGTGATHSGANQIIGVFLAESGEKLFEATPVPDDRENPQMHRWGKNYSLQNPVWSPDGLRYAYTINGALCVNDDGKGRPVLISRIPDNDSINDISFSWSPDGKKLIYIRSGGDVKSVLWNTCPGKQENRIMEGQKACFSQDSNHIAIVCGSKIFLHSLEKAATVQISRGNDVSFSPDDQYLLITRAAKGKSSFILVNRGDGSEKELFNSDNPAFGSCEQRSCGEPLYLSRNLIAFNLHYRKKGSSLCDIWLYETTGSTIAALTRDGKSALREWLSTPSELATRHEILSLGQ